jgi:rubrerythrin
MYPEMLVSAKAEGNKVAEQSFHFANEVEKIHAELYQKLLNSLGSTQGDYPYYVCPVCGFTAEREAPGACPVCGTKAEMFKKIG